MARKRDPNIRLKATDETGKAFKGAQANLRNLASSAAVLEGPLGAVAGRINSVGAALGRMNPLMLSGGIAFASFIAFQRQAIPTAIEYEKQMFRIGEQLKLTGNAAGFTAEELNELSEDIAHATLASAKGVRDAVSVLLQFEVGSRRNFKNLLTVAQSISSVFGGDIVTNIRKLGRAVEDPKKGLESLQRVMPRLNDEFRDLQVELKESGRVLESSTDIVDALMGKFSGQGEAEGKGLAGRVDELDFQWTKLKENLAATWVFDKVVQSLSNYGAAINEALVPGQATFIDLTNQLLEVKEAIDGGVVSQLKFLAVTGIIAQDRKKQLEEQLAAMRKIRGERDKQRGQVAAQAEATQKTIELEDRRQVALRKKLEEIKDKVERYRLQLVAEAKELRKLKVLYEAVRLKSLPPVERLEQEYVKAAAITAAYLAAENASLEEQRAAQLRILERFFEKKSKLEGKLSLTDKIIARFEEQLATEEGAIEKSYRRRRAKVEAALADTANLTERKAEQLNVILKKLDEEAHRKRRDIALRNNLSLVASITSILGSMADNEARIARQTTRRINNEYSDRADIIKKQVKDGVITVDQGNKQLATLERKRQQELDATARRSFEREKKLRKQQIIANTASAVIAAAADTPGPWWVRAAAAIAAGELGRRQLQALEATQYEGGGSIGSISTGGGPTSSADTSGDQGRPDQNININFLGTVIGEDVKQYILDAIYEANEADNIHITVQGERADIEVTQ